MLFDAHEAVKDLVRGHFFTINTGEESIDAEFIGEVRDAGQ